MWFPVQPVGLRSEARSAEPGDASLGLVACQHVLKVGNTLKKELVHFPHQGSFPAQINKFPPTGLNLHVMHHLFSVIKPQYLVKFAIFLGKKLQTCQVQHFGIQFNHI